MWTPNLMFSELGRRIVRHTPWVSYEKRFRFREVEKGKCYRSMQLDEEALVYFWRKGLIGSLVIARQKPKDYELQFAKEHSIPVLVVPIHLRPPTEEEERQFFEFVQNSGQHPVLIHCMHGKDRTGYLVCRYRIERMGWDVKSAWREMVKLGHCAFPWDIAAHAHLRKRLEHIYRTTLKV